MFDPNALKNHLDFIANQKVRKPGFADQKFWEEMNELGDEIADSFQDEKLTDNFINELGDLLFCVLGEPALQQQLVSRMAFNAERAK
jgi:hypothetical protein